jgi:hypothetical protein
MRHANGHARPGPRHAVDARPVLGVPTLRPPLLVDVSASRSREAETGHRARVVTNTDDPALEEDSLAPRERDCGVGKPGVPPQCAYRVGNPSDPPHRGSHVGNPSDPPHRGSHVGNPRDPPHRGSHVGNPGEPPQRGCRVGDLGDPPGESQALFAIRFVLDDDPDDDLDDDDEFGDDEEGEDDEDEENDDEDRDTETWQVSSFEERPKGWLPLDFGG